MSISTFKDQILQETVEKYLNSTFPVAECVDHLHESSVVGADLEDVKIVLGLDIGLHRAVGVRHRHHARQVLQCK